MTLDFLLKAFRKVLQKSAPQNQPERNDQAQKGKQRQKAVTKDRHDLTTETFDDESVDPFNPFPDPVVIEFRDVLDLHSIPPKQVRAVVEDYLEEAHRRGFPYLRIIHGKGDGILRNLVRSHLRGYPQVASMTDEHADRGGAGVTVVRMK